jgi:hypothetical protein
MASFDKSFKIMASREFSSSKNVLHWNKGESGYTYYGIYQSAHPNWRGWDYIYDELMEQDWKVSLASRELFWNDKLTKEVKKFYMANYWNKMKLSYVASQKIADEIFVFAVNTNPKRAVKKAQKLVGVKQDGIIGAITLKALNSFDERVFDREYDKLEIGFYRYLVWINPKRYSRFLDGWINRARAV